MYCFINVFNNRIEKVITIEFEKGMVFSNSIKNTSRILRTHQSLSYVRDALVEFETWCLNAKSSGEMLLRNQHTAERYCRGFLFEFKTYLDHMRTMLTHEYGKGSIVLNDFLNGTHYAYDNSPEYAFTYQLRNCSQHCENVIHQAVEVTGRKGIRPISKPSTLLSDFDGWKTNEEAYIRSHANDMDLLDIFEKTYDALGYVHTPVIQYMLDHDGVSADIKYLREFADWLLKAHHVAKGDIWNWHFAHVVHEDATEATVEEYNSKIADIQFEVQILDWESVYSLTNSLKERK